MAETGPTPTQSLPAHERKAYLPTVPSNWHSMLGVDKSTNPSAVEDLFLTFKAYTTPKINILAIDEESMYDFHGCSFIEGFKFLHPSEHIFEHIHHTYDDGSILMQAIQGMKQMVAGIANSATNFVASDHGVLFAQPKFYNKSERRSFDITLNLFGLSDLDEDIYNPIKFFRNHSYPTRTPILDNKWIEVMGPGIRYPDVFKISGGAFNINQGEETFFALTDMDVTYNDKIPYIRSGFPMQVSLKLTFQELTQMFSDTFSKAKANVKVINPHRLEKEKSAHLRSITKTTLPTTSRKSNVNMLPTTSEQDLYVKDNLTDIVKPSQNPNMLDEPNPRTPLSLNPVEGAPKDVQKTRDNVLMTYLKNSPLYKRATNLPATAKEMAVREGLKIITNNTLYKKVTSVFEVDPLHRLEVNRALHATRTYSRVTEALTENPLALDRVIRILRKSRG